MAYAIETLTGMPAALRDALLRAGITDSEGLLAAARFPSVRDALASELKIEAAELDTWASVADLLRVAVFTPQVAELVVRSGVARSVQELAQAFGQPSGSERADQPQGSDAKTAAQQAKARVASYARERGWEARVPWPDDLALAVEEATNLAPRLALREHALDADMRSRLRSLEHKGNRHNVALNLWSLAIVLGTVGLMSVAAYTLSRGELLRDFEALRRELSTPEASMIVDTLIAWGSGVLVANLLGMAIMAVVVVGLLAVGLFAFDLTDFLWRRFGQRVLFRSNDAQREKLQLLEDEAKSLKHAARAFYATVAIAIAISGGLMWATNVGTHGDWRLAETLPRILALLVPPFIVILFWPSIGRVVRRYRRADPVRASVLRSIIVYRIGDLVRLIAVIVLFILAIAPVLELATRLGDGVTRTRTEEQTRELDVRLDAFMAAGLLSAAQHEGLVERLGELGQQYGSIATTMNEAIEELTSDALPILVRALVPSLLVVLLVFIVVPFLALGGWLRGAFFLVLLVTITFTETSAERLVTEHLTRVFAVPSGSPVALLLIGFAVFGNAILFEWVFESTIERKPPCAGCRAPVDQGARYCSYCGMAQR